MYVGVYIDYYVVIVFTARSDLKHCWIDILSDHLSEEDLVFSIDFEYCFLYQLMHVAQVTGSKAFRCNYFAVARKYSTQYSSKLGAANL